MGRNMFVRNQSIKKTLLNALKVGGLVVAGLAAEKAIAKVMSDYVVDKIIGGPTEAPVVAGLGALQPYRNVIGGLLAATAGIVAAHYLIKKPETKQYVIAGMAAGVLHTVLITVLDRIGQPKAAAYLSGYEDATAARLSAMYGYGATSIQPMYAPIRGLGQQSPYEAAAGAGMGEYFESGIEGLGNYIPNPELREAAAGYGQLPEYQGTHISPNSDLDAQLSIAEAAAGVGQYPEMYQAAAGMGGPAVGEYFRNPNAPMMGLGEYLQVAPDGSVQTVPAGSTWVPGQQVPELWAGVKEVADPQSMTADTPGGVLETPGGSGIFG